MAEQLLHRAQIRAALEQMSRGRVPQPVRPDVRSSGDVRDPSVDDGADGALVDPTAPGTEEQSGAGTGPDELLTTSGQPGVESSRSREPERDGPLLAALAQHTHHVAAAVDVIEVQRDQLPDPDARRVQE